MFIIIPWLLIFNTFEIDLIHSNYNYDEINTIA